MNEPMKMLRCALAVTIAGALLALPAQADDPPAKAPRAEATTDATSWSSGVYEYDGAGNVKRVGDDFYRYDEHGRLKSAEAKTTASPLNRQDFTYDRYGNLLTVTTKTGTTAATVTNVAAYAVRAATNQLDDPTQCPANVTCRMARYDANGSGNQVGYLQDNELQWDALGMMTELDSHRGDRHERYVYDANDERIVVVAKNPAGAETERRFSVRDFDDKVARELTYIPSTNTWTEPKDYVRRDGVLVASFTTAGATPDRHYHTDHLGSTRLITDAAGQRLAVHTYWPFGQEAPGSDVNNARLKFTGHERDGSVATGGLELDYMHARYYDPALERFMSVDPEAGSVAMADPQTWNRYSYVYNNPLIYVDPDGRCTMSTVDYPSKQTTLHEDDSIFCVEVDAKAEEEKEAARRAAETASSNAFFARLLSGSFFMKFDGRHISKYGTGRLFQIRFGTNPNKPIMLRVDYKAMAQGEEARLHLNVQQQGKKQKGFNKHISLDPRRAMQRMQNRLKLIPPPRPPFLPLLNPCMLNPSLCDRAGAWDSST